MKEHGYIGFKEIWMLLKTTKSNAQHIVGRSDFPKPVPGKPPFEELGMGRLWERRTVERWIAKNR